MNHRNGFGGVWDESRQGKYEEVELAGHSDSGRSKWRSMRSVKNSGFCTESLLIRKSWRLPLDLPLEHSGPGIGGIERDLSILARFLAQNRVSGRVLLLAAQP